MVAAEVGGRWNDTALQLVRLLAKHKVHDTPPVLKKSAELAWKDRWWTTLGVAVQNAVASSILAPPTNGKVLENLLSTTPELVTLLDDERG